jgi:hypothetical protein
LASLVVRASNRCVVGRATLSSSIAVCISEGSVLDSTGAPHDRQKFVPGTISAPHSAHLTLTMKTKYAGRLLWASKAYG